MSVHDSQDSTVIWRQCFTISKVLLSCTNQMCALQFAQGCIAQRAFRSFLYTATEGVTWCCLAFCRPTCIATCLHIYCKAVSQHQCSSPLHVMPPPMHLHFLIQTPSCMCVDHGGDRWHCTCHRHVVEAKSRSLRPHHPGHCSPLGHSPTSIYIRVSAQTDPIVVTAGGEGQC